jgi:hypothetical protein
VTPRPVAISTSRRVTACVGRWEGPRVRCSMTVEPTPRSGATRPVRVVRTRWATTERREPRRERTNEEIE